MVERHDKVGFPSNWFLRDHSKLRIHYLHAVLKREQGVNIVSGPLGMGATCSGALRPTELPHRGYAWNFWRIAPAQGGRKLRLGCRNCFLLKM